MNGIPVKFYAFYFLKFENPSNGSKVDYNLGDRSIANLQYFQDLWLNVDIKCDVIIIQIEIFFNHF